MNTNMAGLRWFSKSLCPCSLDKSSLSIGRVKGNDLQSKLTGGIILASGVPVYGQAVVSIR